MIWHRFLQQICCVAVVNDAIVVPPPLMNLNDSRLLCDSTMSDEEDYLSDKFLVNPSETTQPKTYAQKRQQAQKQSHLRNLQNQTKSRRQREQESREDGLRTSLFERAKHDKDAGPSKALGIMMKMGFQPGQSLGKPEDTPPADSDVLSLPAPEDSQIHSQAAETRVGNHKTEPLPLNEWAGSSLLRVRPLQYSHSQDREERDWPGETPQVTWCFRAYRQNGQDGRGIEAGKL